jgi:hypothetical protein
MNINRLPEAKDSDYVIIPGLNLDASVVELSCLSGHFHEKMDEPRSLLNTLTGC